jgi:hypothetical protein
MTNANFAHFLLKFATAIRDIEYESAVAAGGLPKGDKS